LIDSRWMVQVFHPRQKFKPSPFWNCWSYEIKNCVFPSWSKGI
jgi:hypothetical protein